jgi:uncharacterized protein
MKKIILILLLSVSAFAQQIEGSWYGSLDFKGNKIPLVFNIKTANGTLVSTLDSPKQNAKDIATKSTSFINNELTIDASTIGITYKGKFEKDKIIGTFTQGVDVPLVLTKTPEKVEEKVVKRPQTPVAPFNYSIEEVSFFNPIDKNTLAGTLTTSKNKKNFPVVVLITGSGAQNRDSDFFGHKPFWVIANELTNKGIGVLRLDDRGIGQSSRGKETDTSENFSTDINAAVNFLSTKGYKNIGLIGHSEGGMIAPITAVNNKKVKFVVSMAGPGINVDELMVLQTEAYCKSLNLPENITKQEVSKNKELYGFIKQYKGKNLKQDFNLFAENLFKNDNPLITNEVLSETLKAYETFTSDWYVNFLKYNPDTNWSKLKIPVLALNGTKDIQVISKENLAGIKKSLEKAKNKNYEIVEFEGLNHLFQEAKTGSVQEYGDLEQTISPKVLDKISSWILGLKM